MNAEQEAVVHYLQALQDPAVSLDGVDKFVVEVGLQEDSIRVHLHEVKIFVGRTRLLFFFLARRSIERGAL